MIKECLGLFMVEDEFNIEIIKSLQNNPFIIQHLAQKAIELYTQIDPKLVFNLINSVFVKEFQVPMLYPLVNLIDLGITNYYDVSGSLNITMNQVIQHDQMIKRKREEFQEAIPAQIKDPCYHDNSKIKLYRGA